MRYPDSLLVFLFLVICELLGIVNSFHLPLKVSLSSYERSRRNEILRLSDVNEKKENTVLTLLEKLKSTNITAIKEKIEPIYEKIKLVRPDFQSLLTLDWWKPQQWDIPNKLTVARTIAIPLFITAFLMKKVRSRRVLSDLILLSSYSRELPL